MFKISQNHLAFISFLCRKGEPVRVWVRKVKHAASYRSGSLEILSTRGETDDSLMNAMICSFEGDHCMLAGDVFCETYCRLTGVTTSYCEKKSGMIAQGAWHHGVDLLHEINPALRGYFQSVPDSIHLGSYCFVHERIVVSQVENAYPAEPVDVEISINIFDGRTFR